MVTAVVALRAPREGRLYRELTMIEVREVLRRFGAGQSKREIARATSTGRNTVDRYGDAAVERGYAAGAGEPSPELVAAVVEAVQTREPPTPSEQRTLLELHRAKIEEWLQHKLPGGPSCRGWSAVARLCLRQPHPHDALGATLLTARRRKGCLHTKGHPCSSDVGSSEVSCLRWSERPSPAEPPQYAPTHLRPEAAR
jgi:hypothetical protein